MIFFIIIGQENRFHEEYFNSNIRIHSKLYKEISDEWTKSHVLEITSLFIMIPGGISCILPLFEIIIYVPYYTKP